MSLRQIVNTLIALLIFPTLAFAGHAHKEKEYQALWCEQAAGVTEYVLPDDTRVDCLTNEYAVEVDFAPKWAESIGQALYYAQATAKKPGVLLILERPTDDRYLKRLQVVADRYAITVWTIIPADLVDHAGGRPLYSKTP